MARRGTEVRPRERWTADELVESYAEVAGLEPLPRPSDEVAEREGDELDEVVAAEGREGAEPIRAPEPARAVPREEIVDAETHVLLPELDVLTGILDAMREEAPRDDAEDDSVPTDEPTSRQQPAVI